jgi:hypothetical protein
VGALRAAAKLDTHGPMGGSDSDTVAYPSSYADPTYPSFPVILLITMIVLLRSPIRPSFGLTKRQPFIGNTALVRTRCSMPSKSDLI